MSLDNAAMTIYGDSISGNCLKVKFTADLLGLPYDWVETSVRAGQTRTPEFLALNPAGQVPVVVFADNGVLSQSGAIILHLAQDTNLIPTDAWDRARMLQWMFWEQYSHETAIAVRRRLKKLQNKPDSEIDPTLLVRGNKALALMDDHLARRDYFVGERLSLADIALVAYTRFAPDGGFALPAHVAAWVRRVETDLNIEHLA